MRREGYDPALPFILFYFSVRFTVDNYTYHTFVCFANLYN